MNTKNRKEIFMSEALNVSKMMFDQSAFTVQQLMQKLQYLLSQQVIHKQDKVAFGKIGGQKLYYINDIFPTEITMPDQKQYKNMNRLFLMFLKQE